MADWKLIDADGHIREVESDVFDYLPEYYKNRREAVLYFPLLPHHGWHRQAGRHGTGASFLIPTLADWQLALDQGKIEAAVVYPTRFMHIGQVGMTEFAVDLSRAYNDYLHDRFLRQEKRLKGIAVLPLQDVPQAVAELRRAVKEHGMVGGLLPADGLPLPLGHPDFHPLYDEANRLGCMLAVHSQNSLRNNDLFMWRQEAATLAHVWPQMRQFTNLMFSGVLGRFAELKIAFLEAGCGWVPYLMSKMEARMGELTPPAKLIEPWANLFPVWRRNDDNSRSRTARRRMSVLGVGFSPRGDRGHEEGGQRISRSRRYSGSVEKKDRLRKSEETLSPLEVT